MEQASLIIGDGNWAVKSGSLLGYTMFNEQFYPQDITTSRATIATRVNENGLVVTSSIGIARIDYSTGEAALLVEPQRTNLALRSEEFDNTTIWTSGAGGTAINPVRTANSTISPSGIQNADTIIFDRGAGNTLTDQSVITQPLTIATTGTYFFSIWLKATASGDIGKQIFIRCGSAGNLQAVTLTSNWVRYETTATVTSGVDVVQLGNRGTITNANSVSVDLWGAQLEQGTYATSYIPTTSASVTRNADVTSKTGVSSLIGQTEGTIYAEIKVSKLLGAVSRYIFHLSDGTANNRIYMAFSGASSNILRGRIFSGGTLQCTIDSSTITSNGTYKLALAYKNNDIAFYINGVQIGVNTSATIPTGSRVDVGNNYAGASQFSDGISAASIRGTRLTNTQLAALTTL